MHPCNLQCWRVLFILLWIRIVCLCHLSDVRPSISLSFDLLVSDPLLFILRMDHFTKGITEEFIPLMRLLFYSLDSFFIPTLADGFSVKFLRNSKSAQVSRTLLSILAYLNNAEIWMISTCLLISKSSTPFSNSLRIVPSEPITNGITVSFMLHSLLFFISLAKFRYFGQMSKVFATIPGRPVFNSRSSHTKYSKNST